MTTTANKRYFIREEIKVLKHIINSPTGFIKRNVINSSFTESQAINRLVQKNRAEFFDTTKAEYKVRLPLKRTRYYLTKAYYLLMKNVPYFLLPYVEWVIGLLFILVAISPVISMIF